MEEVGSFFGVPVFMKTEAVIEPERIQRLNDKKPKGGNFVFYWMQQSQRARFNHALEYAIGRANRKGQPVLVGFGLMSDYPEGNLRHYRFMLEGLQETQRTLRERGIKLVVYRGHPSTVALELSKEASLLVCDRGYLRHQKEWRMRVAAEADCEVVQIESDLVVPVEKASDKAEYAARTIRPKISKQLDRFLVDLVENQVKRDSLGLGLKGLSLKDIDSLITKTAFDPFVPPVNRFYRGGSREAERRLHTFLTTHLSGYGENSNQPHTESVSRMSMYLHFGQISPVLIALKVQRAAHVPVEARNRFLEELIVRRELAHNFVNFKQDYDRFSALPSWARRTLEDHMGDRRDPLYTQKSLESAETHDPHWNTAMIEMRETGYMHNTMRMYWGKKILEWTAEPREAHRITLELNNRYFLDGRGPNAFANVCWIFGLHDRPWKERQVFGKIRYMSSTGLERKYDMDAYRGKVERLVSTQSM
jgi:deoxyribodipyrimidine photo-lyase